jgi:hypothetical protein
MVDNSEGRSIERAQMITRNALIGGVLAATDKLVKQVGEGDWPSVAKTIEQRHTLLNELKDSAPQTGEHDFLKALRAAVAESDAAVAVMSQSSPAIAGASKLCMKA